MIQKEKERSTAKLAQQKVLAVKIILKLIKNDGKSLGKQPHFVCFVSW